MGSKDSRRAKKIAVILPLAAAGAILVGIMLIYNPLSNASTGGMTDQVLNSNATREVTIGNPAGAGIGSGPGVLVLDSGEEKVAFRFTAKYTGDAKTIVLNLLPREYPDLVMGLQSDSDGIPSGEWLGQPGTGRAADVDDDGFIEVALENAAEISKGEVYHIVIEPAFTDEIPAHETIEVRAHNLNNAFQPLNEEEMDKTWPDTKLNILSYDGSAWEEQDSWPIFVIKYSDGRSEGQPYSLAAQWVIYEGRYVGQGIVPTSNYFIDKIAFYVSKRGNVTENLLYQVRDSKDNVISSGTFAEAGELSSSRKFVEKELAEPVLLQKDKLYRIVLLSPNAALENPYLLYGQEYTYDVNLGYGATRHTLTISYDAGSTWQKWEDADAIFLLEGRQ